MRIDRTRSGYSLIEVIVTLSVIGVVTGVVAFAVGPVGHTEVNNDSDVTAHVRSARGEAIRTGHSVQVAVRVDGRIYLATALPDGRVVADSMLDVDRLNGRPRAP